MWRYIKAEGEGVRCTLCIRCCGVLKLKVRVYKVYVVVN